MHRRTWGTIVAINVILAAAVALTVLFVWDRAGVETTPTSGPSPAPVHTAAGEGTTETPTATAAPTETPPPLLYVVRQGDTLGAIAQAYDVSIDELMAANGIADPNVLRAGQTLVIPGRAGPTPTPGPPTGPPAEPSPAPPLPTPLPTLTPSGPPLVEIGQVLGSSDLAAETVIVRNQGGVASLEAWTLSDAAGNTYTFPSLTLFGGAQVRVHSTAGHNTPSDLYWGRMAPAWDGGELISLRDATGAVVDTYIVP